jgi:hypothetical protein
MVSRSDLATADIAGARLLELVKGRSVSKAETNEWSGFQVRAWQ